MFKNMTPLKKYLLYNRITGSYNLLNWGLTILLTSLLFIDHFEDINDWLLETFIGIFWGISLISGMLLIWKSFSIQKKYKVDNLIAFAALSFVVPWVFNFLIRRKLKVYIKEEKGK